MAVAVAAGRPPGGGGGSVIPGGYLAQSDPSQSLWADAAVRGVLVAAAGRMDMETQRAAMYALANLSGNAANRQPMWADAVVHVRDLEKGRDP